MATGWGIISSLSVRVSILDLFLCPHVSILGLKWLPPAMTLGCADRESGLSLYRSACSVRITRYESEKLLPHPGLWYWRSMRLRAGLLIAKLTNSSGELNDLVTVLNIGS